MRRLKKIRGYLYIIFIFCTTKTCLAAGGDSAAFSLKPAFSFSASRQLTAFGPLQAVLLLPMWTNEYNGVGYSALQIHREATQQAWLLGIGMGYRYLFDQNMLGLHLFLDRAHTATHSAFYFLSPGMEWVKQLSNFNILHIACNTYLPIGRTRRIMNPVLGEKMGTGRHPYPFPIQATQYYDQTETISSGLEVAFSYQLTQKRWPVSFTLNPYFFNHEQRAIYGFTSTVKIPLNRYFAVSLSGNLSQAQKFHIQLGVQLTLDGERLQRPRNRNFVATYLRQPVMRHTSPLSCLSQVVLTERLQHRLTQQQQRIQGLQAELEVLNAQFPEKAGLIASTKEELAQLKEKNSALLKDIDAKSDLVAAKAAEIDKHLKEIGQKADIIRAKDKELADNVKLLGERNAEIARQTREIGQRDQTIETQRTTLQTRDNTIRQRREVARNQAQTLSNIVDRTNAHLKPYEDILAIQVENRTANQIRSDLNSIFNPLVDARTHSNLRDLITAADIRAATLALSSTIRDRMRNLQSQVRGYDLSQLRSISTIPMQPVIDALRQP